MAIYDYIKTFYGLNIEAFDHKKGIQNSNLAIRLEVGYDDTEDGLEMLAVLNALANDDKSGQIRALIIGVWQEAYEESIQPFIDFLVKNNSQFTSLTAIFFAEMTMEDNEISWIQQGDYSALWAAYPKLTHLQIRGAEGLSFGDIQGASLKTLIVETGGLAAEVLQQIADAQWPELEHLELWLGDENYGWNGSIKDVQPLLSAEKFPQLKHLSLKNSEIQDDITVQVISSDLMSQLSVLDLSMGLMTDDGAEALLADKSKTEGLDVLDVSENYLSDAMSMKLSDLAKTVKVQEQKIPDGDEDDEYRYVSVSE